uniref:MATH domain-containing protein n=1 Tax=Oryza punctata TaxID=4537 RepID=A0A0E0LSI9_ORYPU
MAMTSSTMTTGSTCTPQTEQGKHVFEVLGYSRGMGSGKTSFVRSRTFAVGGHDWAIRFYPNGYIASEQAGSSTPPDFVSVYLELLSNGAAVVASCDLSLLNHATAVSCPVHKTKTREFRSDDLTAKRADLEASGYLRHDRLVIECVITVTENELFRKIDVPPSDIVEHIGRFLGEEEGKDVTFSVKGETFTAHSILLAMRSPVLRG